jgi:hypothetical protein
LQQPEAAAGPESARRRARALLAAGALLGLGLAGTGILEPAPSGPDLPSDAAALVNGVAVGRDRYERALDALARDRREPLRDEDRRFVLDRLIEEELLVQRAVELGLDRSDPVVRNTLVSAMIETIVSGIGQREPDAEQVEAFYEEHREYFARADRFWVRQLRFPFDPDRDASTSEREAHALAADGAHRLRAGESHADVARGLRSVPSSERARERRGQRAAPQRRGLSRVADAATHLESAARAGRRRAAGSRRDAAARRRREPSRLSGTPPRGCVDPAARLLMRRLLASSALALLLAQGSADAHSRSISYSTWSFDDAGEEVRARVELRVKLLELTRRPPGHPWTLSLPRELELSVGERSCPADEATRSRSAPEGWAIFRWRVRCETSGPRSITSGLLRDVAPGHTHFLRIDPPEPGGPIREQVLTSDRRPVWQLDTSAESPAGDSSLASYLALGVLHIASGWDHLSFVLALLLLAVSLREVAVLVSGFTIAHSVTLGLAALGAVRPQADAVEVLIGFSIALVAAENGWLLAGRERAVPAVMAGALLTAAAAAALGAGSLAAHAWVGLALFSLCHFALLRRSRRPTRLRIALAFAFGLVHGFGFAGVLMELALPAKQLVPALMGFNVGVELGQLAAVAIAWPVLRALERRSPEAHRRVAEIASALICALGVFWLVSRSF